MARSQNPGLIITSSTGWKDARPEKVNPEVLVCRAGTRITCPRCKELVARFMCDLYSGTTIRADSLEFVRGQTRHPTEKAECRRCGEPYLKFVASLTKGTRAIVHTEYGWL